VVHKAAREGADDELLDYLMSEKFGLDWQKEDSVRMSYFIHIFSCYNEYSKKLNSKQYGDN
jgi:hypothetical protein